MSPILRVSSGRPSGACRQTATPPSTRIVSPAFVELPIRRFDSSTGFSSGTGLTRGEEEVEVVTCRVEVDDDAAKDVGRVLAARVEAHRLADPLGTLRLMDVSMKADHRLVLLDHFAHGFAADRNYARPAAANHRHQRLVELGGVVKA